MNCRCPIDAEINKRIGGADPENIGDVITKLTAVQQTISKQSKKMRPCFTFNKFGAFHFCLNEDVFNTKPMMILYQQNDDFTIKR